MSATKRCRECGTVNEASASFCDNCGAPISTTGRTARMDVQQEPKSRPLWKLIIVGVLGIVVMGLLLTQLLNRESTPEQQVATGLTQGTSLPRTIAGAVCIVPQVVGLTQEAAEELISSLGLQVVKSVAYDATVAAGVVQVQDPASNTRLDPCQGSVAIVVSRGAVPTTAVPTPVPATSTSTMVRPTSLPSSTPGPTPKATAMPEDLKVVATRASSHAVSYPPKNAVDGDMSHGWWASETVGAWLEVFFEGSKTITTIAFSRYGAYPATVQDVTLIFSDNSSQKVQFKGIVGWQYHDISPVTTTSIRIVVDSTFGKNDVAIINEIVFKGR